MKTRGHEETAARDGDGAIGEPSAEDHAGTAQDGEPGGQAGRFGRATALDLAVGGLVLAAYLAVQLWLLLGPRPRDPARYFDTAVDFPDVPVDLWTLRIGLVAPVRLAVLAFGPSEAALFAVPLAAGLLLAAAVYGTMLLLFRDRTLAAAAALVTVLNTAYLFNASYIYPDTTATAALGAVFFCLVLAGVRGGDGSWAPTAAVACAGVLFGASYLIREFSPFLLPAVVVAVILLRLPLRRIGLLAAAAAATAALELVYGLVRYGEPFVHAEELLGRRHSPLSAGSARKIEHIQAQVDGVLDSALVFPRLLLAWRSGWILLAVLLLFAVALLLVRDRRFWLAAAWCLSFWAIMIGIGVGELPSGRWILNVTNVRYWYPMLPALVMGAFAGLWLLAQRWLPGARGVRLARVAAASLAVVVLVPGLAEFRSCAERQTWWNDPAERWHELRSWLATPEAARFDAVWTDGATQRLVPVYAATTFGSRVWDGEVETFPVRRAIRPSTDLGRTLVLVHRPRLRAFGRPVQERLEALRADWSPVFATGDGEMVVLRHESAPGPSSMTAAGRWWDLTDGPGLGAEPGACGRSPYESPESYELGDEG